jgi:uncharacterized membrane protein YfcA
MPAWFVAIFGAAAVVASATASIASAGVDSLLTPVLALKMEMRLAVLAVTAPHFTFNALRCWSVRQSINRKILARFGLTSAVGALGGSLLHQFVSSDWLSIVFAVLLILAGLFGVTGWADRVHFKKRGAYVGGILSGFFGGLTGEQGGLRAAALLGFDIEKEAFVATATAAALIVDFVRAPIYLALHHKDLPQLAVPALVAAVCTVLGTFLGSRLFKRIPQALFSRIVSGILLGMGILLGVRIFFEK